MTRSRRDRISSVNQARTEAGVTPLGRGYLTHWITRNSVGGVPSNLVRVWLRPPKRSQFRPYPERHLPGSVSWHASREDGASALYAEWTLEVCQINVGTVPDDDRMCLRKEGRAGVGSVAPTPSPLAGS